MLVPSDTMREWLGKRLREYQKQFQNSDEALTYWENRGLSRKAAAEFLVGYVERPLTGDARFIKRLAIPYLTPSGVVSFKFRAIDPNNTKRYDKDPGDPGRLFNTRVLATSTDVVITEGEIDAIAASQCGLAAIGIPGATQWKREWGRIFRNRNITVLADGDEAGEQFGEKICSYIYGCKLVVMPPGEDVCSMLQERGEEWIRKQVLE